MSARYERVCYRPSSLQHLNSNQSNRTHQVNAQADDDDDHHNDAPTPTNPTSRQQPIPNSPPPSFHSRASSIHNNQRPVNPDLANAFGADEDDDDSDDDADDRQRLMRRNSSPMETSGAGGSTETMASGGGGGSSRPGPERQTTQLPTTPYTPATAGGSSTTRAASGRVYGGGIQNEGVFSNLTAKPERNNGAEKEELPPVRFPVFPTTSTPKTHLLTCTQNSPTNKQPPTPLPLTGKQPSLPPGSVGPTTSTSKACLSAPSSRLSGTA